MCVLLAQQPHKKETRMKQALSPGPLWGSTVQYLLQTPRKPSKSYSFCCSFDRKSKVVLLVSHLTLSKVFSRLCTIPAQQRPLPGQIPKAGKAQKISSLNPSASEVTTDNGAILRKHQFHLPDPASIFADSYQQITFSELAVPTHAKVQSGCSEAVPAALCWECHALCHSLLTQTILAPAASASLHGGLQSP